MSDLQRLAQMMGCDVMVEKVDGLYWCPDCLTFRTGFALAFAHHRRTVHASAHGRPTDG